MNIRVISILRKLDGMKSAAERPDIRSGDGAALQLAQYGCAWCGYWDWRETRFIQHRRQDCVAEDTDIVLADLGDPFVTPHEFVGHAIPSYFCSREVMKNEECKVKNAK